ncbi:C2H2 transcription factor (Rpn4), putative [Paecilomyces variotii No. 5]|uniref:C2H2 transcription factor (Rpn4), putative n=1 Tax=Byssochlamys spectabilis (strain No. 5 / NBRC 109023) TaxID=1356009 RepID=V5I1J1_BYSSN|nr:C2H2 transcription factor (Rpn4), putative [Paecilomyces variotii No. 5]
MLVHPSVRKDLITEPSAFDSYNYNNINNPFLLQQHHQQTSSDNQLPPEWFQSRQLPQQQSSSTLQSPFQQTVDLHRNASPCSSISASPTFSSPSFASTQQSPATAISSDFSTAYDCGFSDAPSMSASSSFNPSIRIHPSTSSRQFQSQYGSPMLAQQTGPNTHLSPAGFQNGVLRGSGYQSQHKRASSGSSGASTSPLTAAPSGYSSQTSFSPSTSLNGYEASLSKPLPTPVQTPVQNSFLAAPFQNGDNVEAEMAMRRAIMEQQRQSQQQQQQRQQGSGEDESSFQYSLAPSVSSVSHNSPATPQTTYDEVDDGSKAIAHGEDRFPDVDRWMDEYLQLDASSEFGGQNPNNAQVGVPKLDRTISDIYQDELYNPQIIAAPQLRKQPTNQHPYSPYRNLFADRLQAAHQGHMSARSQSPANAMNRERSSPFRQGSPLAADFGAAPMPQNNITSGMAMHAQNNMNPGEPKTISPKDALLEYHETPEENGMPLFPSNQNGGDFNLADAMSLRRQSSSAFQPTQNYSTMEAFPSQYATQAAGLGQQYQFMQPMQQQQHPRSQPQQSSSLIHHTPEFPASLPTMESTGSDSHVDLSAPQRQSIQRPQNTSSDAGTYTCTYHGCTMRFETPAKLQKHKREAHRQTTPGGHLARDPQTGSLAMRNSQAGPHKCERINPSTGKPCNSIFSRPYDLTRHEDTIHNARKQKVRCHLCTEEKTFSRNDALTRHMRVVHPEVDWPGKQKRKGRD